MTTPDRDRLALVHELLQKAHDEDVAADDGRPVALDVPSRVAGEVRCVTSNREDYISLYDLAVTRDR